MPSASTLGSPAIVIGNDGSVSVAGALTSDGGVSIANLNTGLNNLTTKTQYAYTDNGDMAFIGAGQYSFDHNLFVSGKSVDTALGDINTLQSSMSSVQSSLTVDEGNISSLMSSMSAVQSSLSVDEANISSLMSSVSAVQSSQTTDEANIANVMASLNTVINYVNAALSLSIPLL